MKMVKSPKLEVWAPQRGSKRTQLPMGILRLQGTKKELHSVLRGLNLTMGQAALSVSLTFTSGLFQAKLGDI
jgi:hypothetical protein